MITFMKTAICLAAAILVMGSCAGGGNNAKSTAPLTETSAQGPGQEKVPAAAESSNAAHSTVRKFFSTSPQAWAAEFHVISSGKGNILVDPGKYDTELADYIRSIGGVNIGHL